MNRLNSKLSEANQQILTVSQKIEEKDKEKQELEQKFNKEILEREQKYKSQISNIDSKYKDLISSAREKYEKILKEEREGFKKRSKAARKSFKKKLASAKKEYDSLQDQVAQEKSNLSKELTQVKQAMEVAQEAHDQTLKEEKIKHSIELAKERAKANARKRLVQKIRENFKKAGLKAQVDDKTGDVILSFGNEYFDTGKHDLKPGMVNIIEKFIPAYSKSLFENKDLASKIEAVEIIGFASPTYKGKFVDPKSLNPKDRAAVAYNLDLSYRRAKSIFTHAFDTTKISYEHQQDLYNLSKVTGRSFLASKKRNVASDSMKDKYCASNNCKESQRVIIKFNLKN
ncbi:MAG: hypothetical protein KDD61_15800 [Bdellovibrionales bacterium]|nr:hypothetical protein [Bdellovibrionales bacterium]